MIENDEVAFILVEFEHFGEVGGQSVDCRAFPVNHFVLEQIQIYQGLKFKELWL